MSDLAAPAAPAPSTPASAPPAPPATEVAINPNPVGSPQPVGSQAPEKAPGDIDRQSNLARRASIEKAYERSKQAREEAPQRPQAKPRQDAEARQQPAQREGEAVQPYREGGRFARDPGRAPEGQQPPQQQPQQYQSLHEQAPYRDAPQRFGEQARNDWHGTPESVRGAVHQMHREFGQAYEKYRGDVETMDTIRPFHQLATQQGTTLERAMSNYVSMEMKLRQDPIGGLETIVRNLNLPGQNGQSVTLRDLAWHVLNTSPDQHQAMLTRNQQTAQEIRMGQLHQQLAQQGQALNQMMYQQRFQYTRAQVDQFADANPGFDDIAHLVKQELDLGFDLPQAFARASRLAGVNGSPQAAQTRTTPAQTRRTSISGAPDTGPAEGRRPGGGNQQHPTRQQALEKAMRRVRSGV